MRIRIAGRHDPILLTGLTFALLVIFQRPIQDAIDAARAIEQTYDVALMPALLILTVMFVFHQYAKRREMKAEATAAAVEATLAHARAEEMEHLMQFGQELSRSLSTDALHETVWRHLPALAPGEEPWLVLRDDGGWKRVTDRGCGRWKPNEIEKVADLAAAAPLALQERPEGLECDGHLCFVMLAGPRPIGVVGLPGNGAHHGRQTVGAAAALIAIAIRNAQLFAEVREHSVKDALTGCFTRVHAFEVLDAELARAKRAGTPLSVVLFDVDHFKQINDRYGHLSGDSVLASIGQRMKQVLRRSDLRCRYGGDEFLVMLPETSAGGAARVAEWLRSELEQIQIAARGTSIPISISAGVAAWNGGDVSAAALIDRADRALYKAKAEGRNCVRSADPARPEPRGYVMPFVAAAN